MQAFNANGGRDRLSWSSEDPRDSMIFGPWGSLYRFAVRRIYVIKYRSEWSDFSLGSTMRIETSRIAIEPLVGIKKTALLVSNGASMVLSVA